MPIYARSSNAHIVIRYNWGPWAVCVPANTNVWMFQSSKLGLNTGRIEKRQNTSVSILNNCGACWCDFLSSHNLPKLCFRSQRLLQCQKSARIYSYRRQLNVLRCRWLSLNRTVSTATHFAYFQSDRCNTKQRLDGCIFIGSLFTFSSLHFIASLLYLLYLCCAVLCLDYSTLLTVSPASQMPLKMLLVLFSVSISRHCHLPYQTNWLQPRRFM